MEIELKVISISIFNSQLLQISFKRVGCIDRSLKTMFVNIHTIERLNETLKNVETTHKELIKRGH